MENTVTKREMIVEGVKRMKLLNMIPQTIREFEHGTISYSERINVGTKSRPKAVSGILYWLDDDMKAEVKTFEEKYNCMVYHAIHSYTEFGELLSLLYVSSDVEEWQEDNADLKEKVEDYSGNKFYNPFAYVINRTDPDCSEFGRIGIVPAHGGIKRIY